MCLLSAAPKAVWISDRTSPEHDKAFVSGAQWFHGRAYSCVCVRACARVLPCVSASESMYQKSYLFFLISRLLFLNHSLEMAQQKR